MTRKKGSLAKQAIPKHLAVKLGPTISEGLFKKFGYTSIRRNPGCPVCGSGKILYRALSRDNLCVRCGKVFAKMR